MRNVDVSITPAGSPHCMSLSANYYCDVFASNIIDPKALLSWTYKTYSALEHIIWGSIVSLARRLSQACEVPRPTHFPCLFLSQRTPSTWVSIKLLYDSGFSNRFLFLQLAFFFWWFFPETAVRNLLTLYHQRQFLICHSHSRSKVSHCYPMTVSKNAAWIEMCFFSPLWSLRALQ